MSDLIALARVPWVGGQWELIDLQIEQRGGALRSSLGKPLRFRAGDDFRLAAIFIDGNGRVTNPMPSRLRWTLRDAANLEQISAVTLESPGVQTDQPDPYFLLQPNAARLASAARDLLPDGKISLECVMDLDWTIDHAPPVGTQGQIHSSQSLTAVVEFGLGAHGGPDSGGVPPPLPPSDGGSTPPPPPVPPPALTPVQIRELFDLFLLERLPTGEGFLYIRNGDIIAAVPGGDCSTGNTWTP